MKKFNLKKIQFKKKFNLQKTKLNDKNSKVKMLNEISVK